MEKLFEQFSVSQIVLFIVLLATSIRGAFSFFDWLMDRTGAHFKKQEKEKNAELQQNEKISSILDKQEMILAELNDLKDAVRILKESDRDAIKSFITKEYKFYVREQGWIDDYSLEILEKRFTHYTEEGGNSFILKLMEELRALPHRAE